MYRINFKNPIKIHFIGIGGISMSGLAEVLLKEGFQVVGSDMAASNMTERLEQQGIKISIGQKSSNITDDIDLVVYTAAIHPENEEFQAVIAKNIPMLTRAELLGQIMSHYQHAIAVSGTHGKTTTTSMLSSILLANNSDPTILVGGILDSIGGNIRVGNSQVFITEACEYTNSFLAFQPKISIILNVEEDHMDFFKDIHQIEDSFKAFAHKLPDDGLLVINGDMDCLPYITKNLNCKVITVGLKDHNHYSVSNIEYDHLGNGHFDLLECGKIIEHIDLSVAGAHNITNALACIAVACHLNIPFPMIKKGLIAFGGTKRRFEYKGTVNGVTIIDDYAHHPTEIEATLSSIAHYPHREAWVVFQPHTYTRTKAFLKEFASILSTCDHVILSDIYAAREKDTGEISTADLFLEMKKYDVDVHYFPTFAEIETYLLKNCQKDDLLITMGAGNIIDIGESLLNK